MPIDKFRGIICAIPMGKRKHMDPVKLMECLTEFWLNVHATMVPVNCNMGTFYNINEDRAGAREAFVNQALDMDATHILWRDDDVLVPPDALVKAFARNADIVGGLVYTKNNVPQPLIMRRDTNGYVQDWEWGDLVPCEGMGFGFTLMKIDCFKKVKAPWFEEKREAVDFDQTIITTEDLTLMYRMVDAGCSCYCDTTISCTHVDWNTGIRYFYRKGEGPFDTGPSHQMPDGTVYTWLPREQRLAYQKARDNGELPEPKEEK